MNDQLEVRVGPPPARRRARRAVRLGVLSTLAAAVIGVPAALPLVGATPGAAVGESATVPTEASGTGSAASATLRPSGSPRLPAPPAIVEPTLPPTGDPEPTAPPVREPIDYSLVADPESVWITEKRITWCAAAAAQMALAINGEPIDLNRAFQRQIHRLQHRLTTREDGRDAGAGPLAVTESLNQLGDVRYELRIYDTRKQAVRATALAIRETGKAAIWIAWKGIHAWTISGFRADADPLYFPDAAIEGVYVFDPWYPRVSAGWGPSDPPGNFEDWPEIVRNFEKWAMPDGRYPERDGRFVIIVPLATEGD